ncbi:MAG: hypothetical protein ACOC4K_00405 [Verrucomicrobiota bacterium]
MNTDKDIVLNNSPLDYELSELLGEKPTDYLVLCANGERLRFYGTPVDSPAERACMEKMVKMLNDREDPKFWREFFQAAALRFIDQFELPMPTDWRDFHPEFSYIVSRTCGSYSQYLQAAVTLFAQIEKRGANWILGRNGAEYVFEILPAGKAAIHQMAPTAALAISGATRDFLKSR